VVYAVVKARQAARPVTSRMPSEASITEPFTALAELQRQGLIRHLGLSNVTAAQVEEARAIAPVVCVQNELRVFAARSRRRSSVGRTRGVGAA
jgi:aryl-alcohol dehydrogenase-like predicted oxidoreductase